MDDSDDEMQRNWPLDHEGLLFCASRLTFFVRRRTDFGVDIFIEGEFL